MNCLHVDTTVQTSSRPSSWCSADGADRLTSMVMEINSLQELPYTTSHVHTCRPGWCCSPLLHGYEHAWCSGSHFTELLFKCTCWPTLAALLQTRMHENRSLKAHEGGLIMRRRGGLGVVRPKLSQRCGRLEPLGSSSYNMSRHSSHSTPTTPSYTLASLDGAVDSPFSLASFHLLPSCWSRSSEGDDLTGASMK